MFCWRGAYAAVFEALSFRAHRCFHSAPFFIFSLDRWRFLLISTAQPFLAFPSPLSRSLSFQSVVVSITWKSKSSLLMSSLQKSMLSLLPSQKSFSSRWNRGKLVSLPKPGPKEKAITLPTVSSYKQRHPAEHRVTLLSRQRRNSDGECQNIQQQHNMIICCLVEVGIHHRRSQKREIKEDNILWFMKHWWCEVNLMNMNTRTCEP